MVDPPHWLLVTSYNVAQRVTDRVADRVASAFGAGVSYADVVAATQVGCARVELLGGNNAGCFGGMYPTSCSAAGAHSNSASRCIAVHSAVMHDAMLCSQLCCTLCAR